MCHPAPVQPDYAGTHPVKKRVDVTRNILKKENVNMMLWMLWFSLNISFKMVEDTMNMIHDRKIMNIHHSTSFNTMLVLGSRAGLAEELQVTFDRFDVG